MIRFAENLNKMITAGLGGALEAPRTEVAVGHCIRYLESSGAVASFETNIAAPIRSLRVDMLPIQDLHGYDSPWPAGGGKNKFHNTGVTTTSNGVTFTVNADGTVSCSGTASGTAVFRVFLSYSDLPQGESLILNGCPAGGNFTSIYGAALCNVNGAILDSATDSATDSGAGVTYTPVDLAELAQYQIVVRSGINTNGLVFKPMIRLASETDATFAPYSNICPISGRESVTVWREASYNPSADPALTIQLGDTVYGGTLDVSTGKLTVTHGEIASYNGEALPGEWISDRDVYAAETTPTIGAQVVYVLDTPQIIDLDPQQITTLIGDNNVWSDAGDVTLEYPYYEETEGY